MRVHSITRYAALAVLVGSLACARNPEPDTDESAAARDTTTAGRDTLTGQAENPAGMEQDSVPGQTPTDTFLQEQGTGTPTDTAGYGGLERTDTTGQAQTDTTGFGGDTTGVTGGQDTTGMTGADTTTGADPSTGDTTGYGDTQQADSTNR